MLDNNVEATYPKAQSTTEPVVTIKPVNNTQSNESPEAYQRRIERESRDAALLADTGDTSSNKKPNWAGMIGKGLNFAGQNAGNIYDLTRKNEPLETYERAKAKYLDPRAAERDAEAEARRAAFGVKEASGGNAASYLANRVGLNSQNVINKDRIRREYANANAQIGNQNAQFNAEIAMREKVAQAANAAMKENIRSQAIHGMASNFGKMTKSDKQGKMDQKTLNLMMKYYNKYPAFAKMLEEEGWA